MFDDFGDLFLNLITSDLFLQLFPLFVIVGIPLLIVRIAKAPDMLGFFFPWWSSSNSSSSSRSSRHGHDRKSRKKNRSSTSKQGQIDSKADSYDLSGYYPGLVNISGTYCFMNSTIQALSSLTYLQPQLEVIYARAEILNVATPVIDALRDICLRLNKPRSSACSIRPMDLISVLSSAATGHSNSLFSSREHQDAQELFQLLSECIKSESAAIDKEAARDRGLNALTLQATPEISTKGVFDGLTANRRSCITCGYTEAVMHFAFDNWQLAVPTFSAECLLEDLLHDYTRLEILRDCICRKCSMEATHKRLQQDLQVLRDTVANDTDVSASKKRRLKTVEKMEAKVRALVKEGRIEEELKDIRMEKTYRVSTKQAMIARPPPVLALHINRSVHMSQYITKNNIFVKFPEVLDLTPFTTSGILSTIPTDSLSMPSSLPPRSTTPTIMAYDDLHSRTIYRLAAVVCHYGQHSFGHYVCFRRRPRSDGKWLPPRLILDPEKTEKDNHVDTVPTEEDDTNNILRDYIWDDIDLNDNDKNWLRISDDSVTEVGIETVLAEGRGAFMLYYERAIIFTAPSPVTPSNAPATTATYRSGAGYGVGVRTTSSLSSDETLKPELMVGSASSVRSLVSDASSFMSDRTGLSVGPPTVGPRLVRNVTPGRARSLSAAPSKEVHSPSSESTVAPIPIPRANGHTHINNDEEEDDLVYSLSSSAPALLASKESPASSSSSPSSSRRRSQRKARQHPVPVVGLKA